MQRRMRVHAVMATLLLVWVPGVSADGSSGSNQDGDGVCPAPPVYEVKWGPVVEWGCSMVPGGGPINDLRGCIMKYVGHILAIDTDDLENSIMAIAEETCLLDLCQAGQCYVCYDITPMFQDPRAFASHWIGIVTGNPEYMIELPTVWYRSVSLHLPSVTADATNRFGELYVKINSPGQSFDC